MRKGLSRSERSGLPLRTWALAAVSGAATLLSGCGSAVPVRDHGYVIGEQGGAWDVAMSGPEVNAHELSQWPGLAPEYSRLDGKLAVGAMEARYPLDQWPAEAVPRLEERGYILIPRNPGTVTYFRRR